MAEINRTAKDAAPRNPNYKPTVSVVGTILNCGLLFSRTFSPSSSVFFVSGFAFSYKGGSAIVFMGMKFECW